MAKFSSGRASRAAAAAIGKQPPSRQEEAAERRFHVRYIFYFMIALLLALAIGSYHASDATILEGGSDAAPANLVGALGAWLSYGLFVFCGLAAYVVVLLLALGVLRTFFAGPPRRFRFLCGGCMLIFGVMILLAITPENFTAACRYLGLGRTDAPRQMFPGGVIGQFFAAPQVPEFGLPDGLLRRLIGPVGCMVVGWALFTAGAIMIYLADYHHLLSRAMAAAAEKRRLQEEALREEDEDEDENAEYEDDPAPVAGGLLANARKIFSSFHTEKEPENAAPPPVIAENDELPFEEEEPAPAEIPAKQMPEETASLPPQKPVPAPQVQLQVARPAEIPEMNTNVAVAGQKKSAPIFSSSYKLPLVEMLDKGEESAGEDLEAIARNKTKIQNALQNFNIAGQVEGHISGPRLTSYEIRLDPGVPVKKITGLERDFLMALSAKSIRILAPIPGRNVVGLEVPNAHAEAVFMRSILESAAWQNSRAEIPIVLGKNVAGEPAILDLAKAPHLLIAGSTGSGKSVCMNTLIMSLLFNFSPEELRLILVDPKVVEMEDYRKLPHLITPVVNDASKVPLALRWADNEMERRYRVLARAGVKKLSDFNTRQLPPAPVLDENGLPIPDKMPLLIIIVDELADLMMTDAKSDVEKSIARIAQKGRAAGIHLVIATQRPSTNIVTGVIKANLPTKIAFRVTSNVDSRVILDSPGAETLLGRGDMLFIPPGSADMERIQGAMVSDSNIKMIVKFVSDQAPQNFDSQVIAEEDIADDQKYTPDEFAPSAVYSDRGEGRFDSDDDDDDDEPGMKNLDPIIRKYLRPNDPPTMYRALEIIFMEGKASTSYFQRRLSIGYNSAAELVDQLEKRGVISAPLAGGQKREILVTDALEVNEN